MGRPAGLGPPVLRLFLVDAELELGADGALLDRNVHAEAATLPDGARRGRPDIVHHTLLTALESPLAKGGGLEVAVHTRHGILVTIRPDTRLPRSEARFQGVMAQALAGKARPDALVKAVGKRSPSEVLGSLQPVVRLDETGTPISPASLAKEAVQGNMAVVLGAFPSGDFSAAWKRAAPRSVSLWPTPLNAWAVAAEVVAAFRAQWGPHFP
ncbi:MAG: 16S rRNA methyltransferase [Thermoplasmatota archaeon]